MPLVYNILLPPLAAMAVLAQAGCAFTPPPNLDLDDARHAYSAALNDPVVTANAATELAQAHDTLRYAEMLWKANAAPDDTSTQAYIAHRQIDIAHVVAAQRQAEAGHRTAVPAP